MSANNSVDLKDLRAEAGVKAKDMIQVVKGIYPKYDKSLHSKCERGSDYGIMLRPDAMDALCSAFSSTAPGTLQKRKGDGHRFTCRVSCRLSDDEYNQLQRYVRANGYFTMQNWLYRQIKNYLKLKQQASQKKK